MVGPWFRRVVEAEAASARAVTRHNVQETCAGGKGHAPEVGGAAMERSTDAVRPARTVTLCLYC